MNTTKKVLRNIAAIILLIAGIIGLILPIIPQIPFLIGALLVSDFERKHALMRWLLTRKLIRKVLGAKVIAKLQSLDPARRKRDAAAAAKAWPPPPNTSWPT